MAMYVQLNFRVVFQYSEISAIKTKGLTGGSETPKLLLEYHVSQHFGLKMITEFNTMEITGDETESKIYDFVNH